MAELQSSYQSYGGDRKLEFVKGHTFGNNQIYITRSQSPEPSPIPTPRVSRVSKKSSSSSKKSWSFNDPEMKRRQRIVKYKAYAVEGKVKTSFRKGFRWIKSRCSEIVQSF